jgi:hyperosmotically inducible protein
MKTSIRKNLLLISSLATLLALGACQRNDGETVGEKADTGASKTEQAARNAEQDVKDATASAGAAVKNAGEETRAMGAAAADKVEDAVITTKVNAALASDKDLSAVKIDVDTKNGVVTLTGPAPTASARDHATELARNVKGVTSVNNQLTVKAG